MMVIPHWFPLNSSHPDQSEKAHQQHLTGHKGMDSRLLKPPGRAIACGVIHQLIHQLLLLDCLPISPNSASNAQDLAKD
jgi:hypothetical protein